MQENVTALKFKYARFYFSLNDLGCIVKDISEEIYKQTTHLIALNYKIHVGYGNVLSQPDISNIKTLTLRQADNKYTCVEYVILH